MRLTNSGVLGEAQKPLQRRLIFLSQIYVEIPLPNPGDTLGVCAYMAVGDAQRRKGW